MASRGAWVGSRHRVVDVARRCVPQGGAGAQDPVEVIVDVGRSFAELELARGRLAARRLRAVADLRAAGWSYTEISNATGLSRARVAQLSRAAGALGTRPLTGADDPAQHEAHRV